MNFKRLFATAVVVNVALLGIVLWLWSSRKQSPPEKPAQTTPQPGAYADTVNVTVTF